MSSLIETTVGEVRQACERAYAKYDEQCAAAKAVFQSRVDTYNSKSWFRRFFFESYPRWDWHLSEWWDHLTPSERRCNVWRLQQSIKDVPNHTVMHLTVEDARLIELGTRE